MVGYQVSNIITQFILQIWYNYESSLHDAKNTYNELQLSLSGEYLNHSIVYYNLQKWTFTSKAHAGLFTI